MPQTEMMHSNADLYASLYEKNRAFLEYPADWILRFFNMYLRKEIPTGRILDYGCGSANNSVFFIDRGYEVHGLEVSEEALDLAETVVKRAQLSPDVLDNFRVVPPNTTTLDFEDEYFDFVLCNQVLYYLATEDAITQLCDEFSRCLRPGGVVFFTMYGPSNYYITHHTKQIINGSTYEIRIDNPDHRLYGLHEFVYLVRDEEHLRNLFHQFDCVTTGHFDQGMFDMKSNFHWIFVGKKPR